MLKLLSVALVATLAVPAAAANAEATTAEAAATEATAAKPAKKERLICKRETATDSLVKKKRICLTAEGWKQSRNLTQENVKKWQDAIDSSRRAN